MNCHDVRIRLDHPDYATDGTLTPDALAHIEGCVFDNNEIDIRIDRQGDFFDNFTNTNTFGASSGRPVTYAYKVERVEYDEIFDTTTSQVAGATIVDVTTHPQGFYSFPDGVGRVYPGTVFKIEAVWKVNTGTAGDKKLSIRDAANGVIANIGIINVTSLATEVSIVSTAFIYVKTLTDASFTGTAVAEETGRSEITRAASTLDGLE